MKNWKEELSGLLKSGCTDSDIRQFIQKHPDISGKKIWNYVSDYYAPEQCKGCKHVQLIGMYPCSCCSVNGTSKTIMKRDRYESKRISKSAAETGYLEI